MRQYQVASHISAPSTSGPLVRAGSAASSCCVPTQAPSSTTKRDTAKASRAARQAPGQSDGRGPSSGSSTGAGGAVRAAAATGGSLPFNGGGWLAGNVIDDAIHSRHLVDDAVADAAQHIV